MWTSTAVKPAASNAPAISYWLLTPCSRRMAIRGRLPVAIIGAAMSSAGSNVRWQCRPVSVASASRAYSWSAQSGLSRRRAIRQLTSLHTCCSSARGRERTDRASRQTSITSRSLGLPTMCEIAPRPSARSAFITSLWRARSTCSSTPSSSLNSARSVCSLRRTLTCSGRILKSPQSEATGSMASTSMFSVTPQWPAKAISQMAANRPPSERS